MIAPQYSRPSCATPLGSPPPERLLLLLRRPPKQAPTPTCTPGKRRRGAATKGPPAPKQASSGSRLGTPSTKKPPGSAIGASEDRPCRGRW
jgi:hypothetical protein